MTLGGKPTPVYVVTDEEIAAGYFTVEAGSAIAVSQLEVEARGVSGGLAIPVYPVSAEYVNEYGLREGIWTGSSAVRSTDCSNRPRRFCPPP